MPLYYNYPDETFLSANIPLIINVSSHAGPEYNGVWVKGRQTDELLRLEDTVGITLLSRNRRTEMLNPVMGIIGVTAGFAPSTTASTGVTGQMSFDSNYFYVCVGTNKWKRAGLTGW